jgi:hypothetical protein
VPGSAAVTPDATAARQAPASRRPAARRRLDVGLSLGAVAAGITVVGLVDPNEPGHYPLCPFRALTGLDCPGCGSLRAVHALAHGDPIRAADHNLLLVLLLPLLAAAWLGWALPHLRGRPARSLPAWAPRATLVALVVFGVLRNLPIGGWLASS